METAALIWFVITIQPDGSFEARPFAHERACQAIAAAYRRIERQTGSGRSSFCTETTEGDIAAFASDPPLLR